MKTKEIVKLNERYSIIEAVYEKKDTEYVVCANYDPNAEPYKQWDSGVYCTSLEEAIKYAALHSFEPIHRYMFIETYPYGDIIDKLFKTKEDAYKELKNRYDEYYHFEDCYHGKIEEENGYIYAELLFKDGDNVYMKIVEIII